MAGTRVGRVVVSLTGVPVGLTGVAAVPLANNFAHALIRADTSSRVLAAALRRAGLPGRLTTGARYRHSRPGAVPSTGALDVPGEYRVRVSERALDPTNPHDHVNRFDHHDSSGRVATLDLTTADAVDRFCLPPAADCTASVAAPPGSALARLLGGGSAPVRVGVDHARIARLDLALGPA